MSSSQRCIVKEAQQNDRHEVSMKQAEGKFPFNCTDSDTSRGSFNIQTSGENPHQAHKFPH